MSGYTPWHFRYTAPGTERGIDLREAVALLTQALRLAQIGALEVTTLEAPDGTLHVTVSSLRDSAFYRQSYVGQRRNWTTRLMALAVGGLSPAPKGGEA